MAVQDSLSRSSSPLTASTQASTTMPSNRPKLWRRISNLYASNISSELDATDTETSWYQKLQADALLKTQKPFPPFFNEQFLLHYPVRVPAFVHHHVVREQDKSTIQLYQFRESRAAGGAL